MRSRPPALAPLVCLTILAACSDGSTGPPSVPAAPALLSSTAFETKPLPGCFLITFEGGGHGLQIHPESGGLVPETPVRFPLSEQWVTLTSGNYDNNPSGQTIALSFDESAVDEVTFEVPMSHVSLFYASAVPITLDAFNPSGALVASTSGPANAERGFTVWDPIGVDAVEKEITRVAISGQRFGTAIDDLEACLETVIEIDIDLKPQNADNVVDPFNLQSKQAIEVAALSSVDFDATALDPLETWLDDPRLGVRVAPRSTSVADVNGDGLEDTVFDFGLARELGEAGVLDAHSTEVRLFGWGNGQWAAGTDAITIAGGTPRM